MYRMTNSGTKRPHTYHHGDLSNALVMAGLGLAREFLLDAHFSADGAPENPVEHRSFLFNR